MRVFTVLQDSLIAKRIKQEVPMRDGHVLILSPKEMKSYKNDLSIIEIDQPQSCEALGHNFQQKASFKNEFSEYGAFYCSRCGHWEPYQYDF